MKLLVALFSGILFGVGLSVAQMTDPAKVLGFLDITGNWDPSLALVMGGALLVNIPATWFISQRKAPLFAHIFHIPSYKEIDVKLITGSVLFGVGWGLAGYCPGPLFTSVGVSTETTLWVFGAYIIGTILTVRVTALVASNKLKLSASSV